VRTSAAIPALTPLVIGTFPQTEDGQFALDICKQWANLRTEYVTAVAHESTYQLNVWFEGPTWMKVRYDFGALGPVYSDFSTAFTGLLSGEMASNSLAQQADKACEDGVEP